MQGDVSAKKKRIVVGITGASGSIYGVRTLEVLKALGEYEVHLVISEGAERTMEHEIDMTLDQIRALADVYHPIDDLAASISSGSFRTEGMIVAPCSMKTVAGIASGYSDNLLLRAADVTLKERRRLVLVPRETPLHSIHLENLLRLSKMGVTILMACPNFYSRPKTVDDMVNSIVGRALDQFGIDVPGLMRRWREPEGV
jgi:4-hydroxy-3-polyprenylbenzoate decarboxylase